MTKVTPDQFEWRNDRLIHTPTGAAFHLKSQIVNLSNVGDVLEDGSSYGRDEVLLVANNLIVSEKERRESLSQ
ncbi:hypothetical protein SAMN04488518_109243 [Pseudovibrio ascidiaceicola]|uniref:Uncharacterized protein n=1 Tax=Pseudovibrio ascidiaceicola TaxID=285279 RepID=A0A1I4CPG3_9HYPH|nr:hypothetical protein [Pseudovibrio ascidiaceicola]SFK82149.1 hypothetical protein SAMN04488518_109243 [Pseudovibrio ascidiaceicola]